MVPQLGGEVSLPENIVGRSAVLHFRRCHALAGGAAVLPDEWLL